MNQFAAYLVADSRLIRNWTIVGARRTVEIVRPSPVSTGASKDVSRSITVCSTRTVAEPVTATALPTCNVSVKVIQMDSSSRGHSTGVYDWNRSRTRCVDTAKAPSSTSERRFFRFHVKISSGRTTIARRMKE